jgi:hypothetical protein
MKKKQSSYQFLPIGLIIAAICFVISSGNLFAQSNFPEPETSDEKDFIPIFDGKSLKGWEGDPVYWRVEDGKMIGEVTPETILQRNTFLIWCEGTTGDFELKLEYKVSAEGNSGINYRSYEVAGVPFALRGYQCDIDGQDQWSGQNYEERGRAFLALRGQMTQISENEKPVEIASLGGKDQLTEFIHKGDWNECHIVIRGNTLIHMINNHVMSIVVDNDIANRKNEGLLGIQVHVGPPMKIEYRNIRIKNF